MQLSNAPTKLVEAWATGDSTKTNPIPVPSQTSITPGAASWTDGFPPLCASPLASGGIPPSKADMNGGLYQMSAIDVWASAGAGFPYDAAFSASIGGYPKGARVLKASGLAYWLSTVDNNVTDPDTGGAGWASDGTGGITALTGDVTATGPGSAAATLATSGVTAGSYTQANVTIDAKGRVTSASNGSGSSGFTYGSDSNGNWEKNPIGTIQQWGSGNTDGSGNATITFPTPFTSSYVVIPSVTDNVSHTSSSGSHASLSSVPVFTWNEANDPVSVPFDWYAIGK